MSRNKSLPNRTSFVLLACFLALAGSRRADAQDEAADEFRALGIPLYNSTWYSFTPGDRSPLSLARHTGAEYFSASGGMLRLVNVPKGESTLLRPPQEVKTWSPMGVVFNQQNSRPYVANFTGSDVLVMKTAESEKLSLVSRITDEEMKTPISVATDERGSLIAVADYGADALFLFDAEGNRIWKRDLRLCHGVCFSHDGKSVIATCLYSRELVRFSLEGDAVKRVGKQGWWRNEYLWPTGISPIGGDRYLVADAHTGQLSILNEDLDEIRSVGGNGPGMGLFNMPYHAVEGPNGTFVVADTYKNRIVQIDWMHNEVICALYCDDSHPLRLQGRFNRESYQPLGFGYAGYINRGQNVFLSRYIGRIADGTWHVGYNEITSQRKRVTMEGPVSIVGCDSFYFVQAAPVVISDRECLVVGSPQRRRWLVICDGVFATVELQGNLWIAGDELAGDFGANKLHRIAQHGMVKINNFQRSTVTKPYERVGSTLFADVPYSKFSESMHEFFVSSAGKQLYEELMEDKPNFEAYFAAMDAEASVPLLEFCFVNALLDAWR